ncbi:MAG: succinate dehydrogenase, cytochrome b556 subunit [Gammaproteobacteria bacterium RIFCSPHIGHO2_12_FULL_45_9]|nr:MAG: succinate dehydrogenase, cytochrome b556 subunit [Gammaproteobacteria bacterium RIFCSPHIGHO2_12_FULL_45_9]
MEKHPVNLDLLHFKFPITAILSIGHRIAGVLMFLLLPLALWMLGESLRSADDFDRLVLGLQQCFILQALVWVLLSATWFHLLAGVRHLCMDCGWGETFQMGSCTARLVFVLFAIGCIGLGVWIW